MKTVCAWCEELMEGDPNAKEVSHGICSKCEEEFNGQLEEYKGTHND